MISYSWRHSDWHSLSGGRRWATACYDRVEWDTAMRPVSSARERERESVWAGPARCLCSPLSVRAGIVTSSIQDAGAGLQQVGLLQVIQVIISCCSSWSYQIRPGHKDALAQQRSVSKRVSASVLRPTSPSEKSFVTTSNRSYFGLKIDELSISTSIRCRFDNSFLTLLTTPKPPHQGSPFHK